VIAGEIGLTPKEAASVFAVYATIEHEAICHVLPKSGLVRSRGEVSHESQLQYKPGVH